MSAEALLEKVKGYIEQANEQDLADLEDFLDTNQTGRTWDWNDLPDDVRAGIEEGIAQADRGETITWEAYKQANPQWFSK